MAMISTARPEALQGFLDSIKVSFEDAEVSPQGRACLSRVFAALQHPGDATEGEATRLSTNALLDSALEPARHAGGSLAEVANRIQRLDPLLRWRRRSGAAPNASRSYAEGHANAMVVGPGGLEHRTDVWVGLSLLAPGVRYPDHNHGPEEVYLVLTDGQFRQDEGGWFKPGIGGTLYNKPNVLHAMASSEADPFLAVWCLCDGGAL